MRQAFGKYRTVAALMVAFLAWGGAGLAGAPGPPGVMVRVSANQASPGLPLTISGSGFQPGEAVAALWEVPVERGGRRPERRLLAETVADGQGRVANFLVTFPSGTPDGQQVLLVAGRQSRRAGHLLVAVQTDGARFTCTPRS